jgi:uncharacterized membrane protein
MTRYELLLSLHVISVTIWLGAGFVIAVLILGAERAGDHEKEARYHADVPWLAPRLFIPAALATLIFGMLLVADGDWDLDQLWVAVGLVGWLLSFGLGFLYFRPEGERIGELVTERGPTDPEVGFRIRRLNVVDRLQLLILFTVVADMVIKPTEDDTGVVIVGAALLAVGAAMSVASVRRAEASAESSRSPGVSGP